MEAVRFALGGFSGAGSPVSLRKAQQWVARVAAVGLVDRQRLTFRDGSIVWATHQATGKAAPNLYRQTTRHEIVVASASARFVCRGYSWERDRKPENRSDHQADGVAVLDGVRELVEVELTPKTGARYGKIIDDHARRLEREGFGRVIYFGTPTALRAAGADEHTRALGSLRSRFLWLPILDARGQWPKDDAAAWARIDESTVSAELEGARTTR
nr:hypothetical protein [Herbiconiux sp. KACC 21604]